MTGGDFRSDNTSTAHPAVLAALIDELQTPETPYGDDAQSHKLTRRLEEWFETELCVFPVATGTAANALAVAAHVPSYGGLLCHRHAHILEDECGALSFFSGGCTLHPLAGVAGKIMPKELMTALSLPAKVPHQVPLCLLSLAQASERGRVYSCAEIAELSACARQHGLFVHMDGARFANALAFLGASPAEMTWRAGVQSLSFGLSKNGAIAAEAVILFGAHEQRVQLTQSLIYRRKQSGHLFSKQRFFSAQFLALLAKNHWKTTAQHANAMAQQLAQGLITCPGIRLLYPAESNVLFFSIPRAVREKLRAAKFHFLDWPEEDADCVRLVTSFTTKSREVTELIRSAQAATRQRPAEPV